MESIERTFMNCEGKLISLIVREVLFSNKKEEIKDLICDAEINWGNFKDLITYHELMPFVYPALKDFNSKLTQDLKEFLESNYYCTLVRCEKLSREFLRISEAFDQAGLTLLPIKGVALLYDVYSHKPVRPMTDIDLLVKEENLQKAEMIFCDLGYRKELYGLKEEYWRGKQCHVTFCRKEKDLPFVELHWSLDFKRRGCTILPELWKRIREVSVNDCVVKVLSPEDTLFSLALHNRRFGKTLSLKNIFDTALLLNKTNRHFDWDYCLKMSKKYKICSTLFFILYQVKLLSEIDIPEYVWKGLNLPIYKRKMIQYFIENNTFRLHQFGKGKNLYLKSHFLLYDSFWEPIDYILNIPREQFAKFYNLKTYDKKTDLLYRNRLLYMSFSRVIDIIFKSKQCR